MKKRFLSIVAVAMVVMFLSVGSVFAADGAGKNFISNKVGVGYQGMVAGDYLNGISARGWIGNNFGLEASVFYGSIDADVNGYGNVTDSDMTLFEAKAMYAFLVKQNSRFYVGAKGGVGKLDYDIDDDTVWTCGAFVGSEWNFQGIPELGFNFDVGYNYIDYDDDHVDIKLDGIAATFGIHYYF